MDPPTNASVQGAARPAVGPLGPADSIRARELYKYYNPEQTLAVSQQSAPPNTVLTAYAQLVAWRLNVQRSLISLIDKETQYFVAESTKTLSLDDSTMHEDPDDAVWAGCINVPKAGRLCEHTLQTIPGLDGSPACFEVLDLSEDPRFNELPFVAGPPYFRYYAGVPIRTKKGVNIGSLFGMDVVARQPQSKTNKLFLTTMAANVMTHLETVKEKQERKRALNMNMCLAAFVDPQHQRKRRRTSSGDPPLRRPQQGSHRGANRRSATDSVRPSGRDSPKTAQSRRNPPSIESVTPQAGTTPEQTASGTSPKHSSSSHHQKFAQEDSAAEHSESKHSSSDASHKRRVDDDDHFHTFQRASELLYDSLSLHNGGGVVFFDTLTSIQSESDGSGGWNLNLNENTKSDVHFEHGSKEDSENYSPKHGASAFSERQPRLRGMSGVLGAAGSFPTGKGRSSEQAGGFNPISAVDLHKFIKRHPRGQLFNLDLDGFTGSSSSGDEQSAFNLHVSRKSFPSAIESSLLNKSFPSARQVIFIPLYDNASSRWSTCFVYNTYAYHDITQNPDFLYCIAFCNCVMAEIGRLATLAADQQKSDFIGSISHELRSPLHGILASMEFLHDTDTTSFQKSLVETADACARTLLDTINMVLDYSRLNAFERNANKARRSGKRNQLIVGFGGGSDGLQSHLNIYGDVDLAAITEEVVEGVSTGQVFKDITTVEGEDIPINQRRMSASHKQLSDERPVQFPKPEVDIIIDISTRAAGWNFVTQPGAFRRIVMNLFGNSLKYTKRGHIIVKLDAEDVDQSASSSPAIHRDVATWITLKVSDTGKGISPDYLRNKLFTPFAQESSMNPGTGLGLSLVKGIVNMLAGEISVRSTVGIGTEITVKLPMVIQTSSTTTPSPSGSSIERAKDNSIPVCRAEAVDKTVAIYWQPPNGLSAERTKSAGLQRQTLKAYFLDWFGFANVLEWESGSSAQVVAVDETDIDAVMKDVNSMTHSKARAKPMILAFCGTASRLALTKVYSNSGFVIEFLCVPVGPYKLARTLRLGFEAYKERSSSVSTPEGVTSCPSDPLISISSAMEHVTITSGAPDVPDMQLLKTGAVVANMTSNNATMALSTPNRSEQNSTVKGEDGYHFSTDAATNGLGDPPRKKLPDLSDITSRPSSRVNSPRQTVDARNTLVPTRPEIIVHESPQATSIKMAGALSTTFDVPLITALPTSFAPRQPRLLLVDDNPLNLRLLQTFMRKRKHDKVVSAEDGAQAVSAFRAAMSQLPREPPDIIFMDISMPVLDGFAATRQIREIEAEIAASLGPMETPPPSLVIALTGLASGRDQSEAFVSGFDLYMTKPVSFREVGRLLDNWQANGGATGAAIPHGSVTAPVG